MKNNKLHTIKKSFTLIELIFVIVIIGLLASVAVPKFASTKAGASVASAKAVVSSVRTAVETRHGEWIINDDLDTNDGYTPQGYPQKLDEVKKNEIGKDLFIGFDATNGMLHILKTPIKSCMDNDCWYKYDDDNTDKNLSFYAYRITVKNTIYLEYNGSNGKLDCDASASNKDDCESFIN